MRQRIEQAGGGFARSVACEDLDRNVGHVRGLALIERLSADGRGGLAGHRRAQRRDTYEMLLARGVALEPKPFQLGVRIEQPQEQVNRFQYGARSGSRNGWGPPTTA